VIDGGKTGKPKYNMLLLLLFLQLFTISSSR
jgi:hypothetical protein